MASIRSFRATLVYGVLEVNYNYMLDPEWLSKHFPYIRHYTADLEECYAKHFVYGVKTEICRETGHLFVSAERKKMVQDLYNHLWEYETWEGIAENARPILGFFPAITGRMRYDHDRYIPTMDS